MLLAAAGFGALVPGAAHAQREIVQPLPAPELADLRRALTRLASEPRNVDALIEAGNASLALEDVDAAIGFFGRADALDPGNARVKLGLAASYVVTRRPIEALRLFHEAEAGGADAARFAAKRGLAFDLVGDNASAQAQYRLALTRRDDPRVREQLAISQAVSGDRRGFEATLLPLLKARDMGAYRTRAFGLAILDREKEAADLAKEVMPAALAQAFLPYLNQLPKLSPVEQVAAVHLGIFPAAGQPARQAAVAAVQPSPAKQAGAVAGGQQPPARSTPASSRMTPAGEALGGVRVAQAAPAPAVQSAPVAVRPVAQPVTPSSVPPVVAVPAATLAQPVTPPPSRPSLDTVFAGLIPAGTATPAPGAVDVSRIVVPRDPAPAPKPAAPKPAPAQIAAAAPATGKGAKPTDKAIAKPAGKPAAKAAAAAKPAKPAHPARVWVQLAAGSNRDALAFDWRRLSKAAGKTLAGKEPHVTQLAGKHRLLAGPYPTAKAADDAVRALRAGGLDSLRYESPEGQEVAKLK